MEGFFDNLGALTQAEQQFSPQLFSHFLSCLSIATRNRSLPFAERRALSYQNAHSTVDFQSRRLQEPLDYMLQKHRFFSSINEFLK